MNSRATWGLVALGAILAAGCPRAAGGCSAPATPWPRFDLALDVRLGDQGAETCHAFSASPTPRPRSTHAGQKYPPPPMAQMPMSIAFGA